MPKYRLTRYYQMSEFVEVEASSKDEAKQIAEDDADATKINVIHENDGEYEVHYSSITEIE